MKRSEPTLAIDVECARCKYNLRGLPLIGTCPECGHPVRKSLRPSQQWSVGSGFRRAFAYELRWGAICFVCLSVFLWLAAPYLNGITVGYGAAFLAFVLLGFAAAVSSLMWARMVEAVGFTGLVLGLVAVVSILTVTGSSAFLVHTLGPLESLPAWYFGAGVPIMSWVRILYDVWFR